MRASEVRAGREYLTRTITVRGIFGPRKTRGHVRADAIEGGLVRVTWLRRDGSRRTDARLPEYLRVRQLLTEVDGEQALREVRA